MRLARCGSTHASRPGAPRVAICNRRAGSRHHSAQLVLVERRPRDEFHDGDDLLPEPRVGHADHDAVEHARVLAQLGFDLVGVDLLAAGVDARGAPTEKLDRAVGVDGRVVARDRVAAPVDSAEGGRGLVGILVVAHRDVAAHGEEPGLAAAGHDVAPGVLLDHADALVHREPGRCNVVVGARAAPRSETLAGAERVDDGDTGEVRKQPTLDRRGEHDPRRRDRSQRRQVPTVGLALEGVEQRAREHIADDGEDGDALARHRIPHVLHVESLTVDQHHRARAGKRRQRGEQPGAMHERRGRQRGRATLPRACGVQRIWHLRLLRVRLRPERAVDVVVAPHHALGQSGGAAGVQEDQIVAVRPPLGPPRRNDRRPDGVLVRRPHHETVRVRCRPACARARSPRRARNRRGARAPWRRSSRAGSGAPRPGTGS